MMPPPQEVTLWKREYGHTIPDSGDYIISKKTTAPMLTCSVALRFYSMGLCQGQYLQQ